MKKISFILLMVLLLSVWLGCASVGKDFNSEKVKDIKNNITTQLNIIDWFGLPFKEGNENGYTMWTYQFDKWNLGGVESKGLVILFDDKNKVKAYRYDDSNYKLLCVGRGFLCILIGQKNKKCEKFLSSSTISMGLW